MKLPTGRRCGAVGSMLPPRASSWIIMAGRYRCQECGFYSTVEEASVVDSLKSEAQDHLKFIPQHSPLRTEKACGLSNKPHCRRECLRVPPPLPLPIPSRVSVHPAASPHQRHRARGRPSSRTGVWQRRACCGHGGASLTSASTDEVARAPASASTRSAEHGGAFFCCRRPPRALPRDASGTSPTPGWSSGLCDVCYDKCAKTCTECGGLRGQATWCLRTPW